MRSSLFLRQLKSKSTKQILEELETKKKGIFEKLDSKFQKKREEMEKEALGKRITPEMKKRADAFFGVEENLKKREKLIQEAFHENYFRNAREVATKGAKLWEAPTKIRPSHVSPKMPDLKGTWMDSANESLLTRIKQHNVTLVCFFFNQFGEENVQTFIEPFSKEFKDISTIGLYEINVNEQTIKSPLVKMITPYLRWKMNAEKRKRYLMVNEPMGDQRRSVGMENQILGWVHLCDHLGFVRWQAHGIATPGELETLSKLTQRLNKR
jgi:hypothetical protein